MDSLKVDLIYDGTTFTVDILTLDTVDIEGEDFVTIEAAVAAATAVGFKTAEPGQCSIHPFNTDSLGGAHGRAVVAIERFVAADHRLIRFHR
jgi:hypothetical protein